MYFVHTCIIIVLAFSFFNDSLPQKKIVKVIEDDIYDKVLEILKGSEKFVLAKFYLMLTKRFGGGWYQTKMLKQKISSI